MGSGVKHFSHKHNLMMHEMPEGAEVSCCGCNSLATKSIYICWQCNFYLHEQCFHATRSRKHPSHPEHPLTLVPYPTYPSNSFFCNSCKIVGTGFSYSCSDCEFDLHVQCVHSISSATNFHQPHHVSYPNQDIVSANVPSISFPAPVPIPAPAPAQYPMNGTQDSYMVQNTSAFYGPTSTQNTVTSAPNSFPPPVPTPGQYPMSGTQDSYMIQNALTFSVPTSAQNVVTSAPNSFPPPAPAPGQYPMNGTQESYMVQNASTLCVPLSAQNAVTSAPNSFPPTVPAPCQYPVNGTQDPYMVQNASTFSVPASVQNTAPSTPNSFPPPAVVLAQYSTNVTQESYMAQNSTTFSVPTNPQNAVPSAPNSFPPPAPVPAQNQINVTQDSYMAQNVSKISAPTNAPNFPTVPTSTHNSSIHRNTPFASVPPSAPNSQSSHHGESGQNKTQTLGIKHFSHPHGLVLVNIKRGKKNISCSGCQETLTGKGYACVEENCNFQLDESCFNLEKEIRHKSHPTHPLTLLSTSPYSNGTFTCSACFKDGIGFDYHCSICEHDLHVKCANLKETVERDDHEHALNLFYECPLMGEEYTFFCDVCDRAVHRDCWTYYCKECDFGTHLDCVNRAVCDETSEDPVGDGRTDEQRLMEAIEVARICALARKSAIDNI